MKLKLALSPSLIKKIVIILLAMFVAAMTTSFCFGIKEAYGQDGCCPQEEQEPTAETTESNCGDGSPSPLPEGTREDLSALTERVEALEGRVDDIKGEIEVLKAGRTELVQELAELEKRILTMIIGMQVYVGMIDGNSESVKQVTEAQLREAAEAYEGLHQELVKKREELATLTTKIENLGRSEETDKERKLKEAQDQKSQLERDIEALNEREAMLRLRARILQAIHQKLVERGVQTPLATPGATDNGATPPQDSRSGSPNYERIRKILAVGLRGLERLNEEGQPFNPTVENPSERRGRGGPTRGGRSITVPLSNRIMDLIEFGE